jgi:hypothetical protein
MGNRNKRIGIARDLRAECHIKPGVKRKEPPGLWPPGGWG